MTDAMILYLFDPLCGWCYGAAPMLDKVVAQGVSVEAVPTGLFAGPGARPLDAGFADYAWSQDQRIAQISGQEFTKAYVENVLQAQGTSLDSSAATLGIVVAGLEEPTRRMVALKAIQRARYVEGRDIVTTEGVASVLADVGLEAAADRLHAPDAATRMQYRELTAYGRSLFQGLNANGVPALVVRQDGGDRLIGADALFGSLDNLLARLRAANTSKTDKTPNPERISHG
ncbi:DsbA family protein [Aestuariispira ectoiniformans]|uniref:DsbA family protein n=1 Tax=Aestuariispira ectoiniformans TaxID=2775080 RepID=UPI00223AF5D9|nr:DsbA family protein [Aestuariispira ectoiniformans]